MVHRPRGGEVLASPVVLAGSTVQGAETGVAAIAATPTASDLWGHTTLPTLRRRYVRAEPAAPLADSVDQAYTPTGKLLSLP